MSQVLTEQSAKIIYLRNNPEQKYPILKKKSFKELTTGINQLYQHRKKMNATKFCEQNLRRPNLLMSSASRSNI